MPTPGCLQTGRLSQKQILSSVTCRTSGPPQRCRAACRTEHQRHSSAIDGRANQHGSYAVSPRIRRRIEQAFGWIKTVAEQAKTSFRDLDHVARALAQTAGGWPIVAMDFVEERRLTFQGKADGESSFGALEGSLDMRSRSACAEFSFC
jgi:hypothetical protein